MTLRSGQVSSALSIRCNRLLIEAAELQRCSARTQSRDAVGVSVRASAYQLKRHFSFLLLMLEQEMETVSTVGRTPVD